MSAGVSNRFPVFTVFSFCFHGIKTLAFSGYLLYNDYSGLYVYTMRPDGKPIGAEHAPDSGDKASAQAYPAACRRTIRADGNPQPACGALKEERSL